MTAPILVALDVPTAAEAVRLARAVAPHVAGVKVGLELLMGPGPAVITALTDDGLDVFADAKLHDIPTTVRRSAAQLGRMGARWVTVHAGGGRVMLEAAVEGLAEGAGGREAGILAVTVLTSMDDAGLVETGVRESAGKQTSRLARLADAAGVEGVICSVKELGVVAEVAPRLVKVTPGIRLPDGDLDDQARVSTPEDAIARGADLLVIGRPITKAPNPAAAAEAIAARLR